MSPLHVGVFRGIVLEGSSDSERSDELLVCDQYELGPRGQLVPASDLTPWLPLYAADGTLTVTRIYALEPSVSPKDPLVVYAADNGSGPIAIGTVEPTALGVVRDLFGTAAPAVATFGWQVTMVTMPYVTPGNVQLRVVLIAVGARTYQLPIDSPGLYVLTIDSAGVSSFDPISVYDALGTGPGTLYGTPPTPGTNSFQLRPRGIFTYHGHVFLWGFDAHDFVGYDGPNRLMFSNIGNPLKYGYDPDDFAVPPPSDPTYVPNDHVYVDSDAIIIGGAGEAIRAACVWSGRAFIATNNGLYFVEGYGRESFLTNGAVPIRRSAGVLGAHCLIEGPDSQLHGVDELGHWTSNGSDTLRPGLRLIDYASHSNGYWDLIWTDPSRADGYPGKSNEDLVWMLSVKDWQQVWIVIPFCDATLGYGPGNDTVVIKYHCATDGYTRQIFYNQTLSAGTNLVRETSTAKAQIIATPSDAGSIARYAYKATPLESPRMPAPLPTAKFGEYAIFGPDGDGIYSHGELTLAWENAASLPLEFALSPWIDDNPVTPVRLSVGAVAPGAPNTGDLWIDTSGSDANLGNAGAGPIVDASPADYLMKRYVASWAKWVTLGGGQQGRRVTTTVSWEPSRGTRIKLELACLAAAGRYHVEGIAFGQGAV